MWTQTRECRTRHGNEQLKLEIKLKHGWLHDLMIHLELIYWECWTYLGEILSISLKQAEYIQIILRHKWMSALPSTSLVNKR